MEQKIDFTAEQMREIAFTYKDRARQGGRALRRRPLRSGRVVRLQSARVVGLAARAPVPPVRRRGRGVGHGGGRAAHGVREPEPRVGFGGHLHPQPARALQPPGSPVRRLRRAQPGRGPGRRPGVPAARLRGAAPGQPDLSRHRTLARARLPRGLRGLLGWPGSWSASTSTTRRRSSSPSSRPRGRPLRAAETRGGAGRGRGGRLFRHLIAQLWTAGRRRHGRGRRRLLGTGGGTQQIDQLLASARRQHRAPAARHGARGHRHHHAGQRHPHGPRRRHLARRRHGQAPGQDGRRRLPRPRGHRASGPGSAGRRRAARRRLAVYRRPHRQHLRRPHPHARRAGLAGARRARRPRARPA